MLIAGNWKMFRGPDPAALAGLDAVVCPPFTRLRDCVDAGLTTYAQNVHWEPEGAYTGEISAPMLLELGVVGSLVGHSERRQYFGETDETVARRAGAALEAGLNVIACVGETHEQREAGEMEDVLRRQLSVLEPHPRLVLAYEPVWAIGTGRNATSAMVAEMARAVRDALMRYWPADLAQRAPVLYGGSVTPDNAGDLVALGGIDGFLVGGASLDSKKFLALAEAMNLLSSSQNDVMI
jgi:triosephosphate isomerase